jgi:release factor glutamine methyltransferase
LTTIHARVADARDRLVRAGVAREEADLDARLLAQHVLGWDDARFLTWATEPEASDFSRQFDALVARRASREPLAYITGTKEFWNLTFEIAPGVLVPRPETELLVETALVRCPERDAAVSIADLCTGSGCVAVALAVERPKSHVTATDISEDALRVARRNAERHQVSPRMQFVAADLFDGVIGGFDLIVSNPPYVAERDRASLPPEVIRYEPAVALFGGADGLTVIRRLAAEAPQHLAPGGVLIFEFGYGQDAAIREIIAASRLKLVEIKQDLQGIPRAAVVM